MEAEEKPQPKWTLAYGCHRGTIASRDAETATFDTLADATKHLREQEAFWASVGYQKWFARVTGPDGRQITL